MRLTTVSILAALATLVWSLSSFAQGGPKDLLIGKWVAEEKVGAGLFKTTLEFTKDALKVSINGFPVDAKYKWVDKDTLEVTITVPDGKDSTQRSKIVSVTKDTLTVKGTDGRDVKFTRVK